MKMEMKLLLLLLLPVLCKAIQMEGADCSPHETVVPVDHPNYGYYPYFVKLHRCRGSCGLIQPSLKECVAVATEPVSVDVFPLTGDPTANTIKVFNHTKCGCQCVEKAKDCDKDVQIYDAKNCQCKCKYANTASRPCPAGFRWDTDKCACVCGKAPTICPARKFWSQHSCGCVCDAEAISMCNSIGQVTDDKCQCVKPFDIGATGNKKTDSKSSQLMLILMVAEFGVLFLVFDAILYRKKAGLTHYIVRQCACKGKPSKEISKSVTSVVTQDSGYVNDGRKISEQVQAV